MSDPMNANMNVLQTYLDAQQQQVFDAVENAKEEKRVRDWAKTDHIKAIKKDEEKRNIELHGEIAIIRHKDPENRDSNNEKIDQLSEDKKKEGHEMRIKRADTNYLDFLEKTVVECREMYASIEYNDREKLSEARRALKSKNSEESISTKDTRLIYEKALTRFKDAKVKDFEERILQGVDGRKLSEDEIKKEVRELVELFGYKEAVELNQARNEAKAETLLGRDVVKKYWGYLEKMANVYNNLPLWSKIGLSLATVAAGAAGAVGVVGAKRVMSGVVTGVGSAKLLDALHQGSMKKAAGKDAEKLIVELGVMEDQKDPAKFEAISALLDAKILDVDKQLKEQKRVALANKFIGIGIGMFFGSGYAAKALGVGFGKISDHFHHGKNAAGVVGAISKGTLADSMEHSQGVHAPVESVKIMDSHIDTHGHIKHDSFSRSLMNYLKDDRLNIDKAELKHIHEVTFRDGVAKYALEHKLSYEEAMHKLSGIHPGTTYEVTWDVDGHPHMNINDGDVKFVKEVTHGHHLTGGHDTEHAALTTQSDAAATAGNTPNDSIWNAEAVHEQNDSIRQLNEQYGRVLNGAPDSGGVLYQDYLDEKNLRIALDVAKKNLAEINGNPDGSYGRMLRNVLKAFSDKNIAEWNRIEKIEAIKLLAPGGGPELGSLSSDARAAMRAYGDLVPPKKGELMGRWVVRFMQAAKDGNLKK